MLRHADSQMGGTESDLQDVDERFDQLSFKNTWKHRVDVCSANFHIFTFHTLLLLVEVNTEE